MIKRNLLPEELKEHGSSFAKMGTIFKLQQSSLRNVAIAAILILVVIHISLFFVEARSSTIFKSISQKYKKLLPGKKEYEELRTEVSITNKKAKVIEVLMANRFSWASKLNDLSDSMTPGIWLTAITYEEKPSDISVQVAIPALKAGAKRDVMKTETQKVNLRFLNISGYASSMGEQGTALVGKFIKGMKDDPTFFSDFSDIKLESIKSEKVLDQEVMAFQITCQFKK